MLKLKTKILFIITSWLIVWFFIFGVLSAKCNSFANSHYISPLLFAPIWGFEILFSDWTIFYKEIYLITLPFFIFWGGIGLLIIITYIIDRKSKM